jgi:hypothetical protein
MINHHSRWSQLPGLNGAASCQFIRISTDAEINVDVKPEELSVAMEDSR